jgi:hypothetical protein
MEEKTLPVLNDILLIDKRPSINNCLLVQEYVIVHFVLMRPTMRSQNFLLEILPKLQNPISADRNGIYIESEEKVLLQYCKYKTTRQYGFITFHLEQTHAKLINEFMKVRKWFFQNPEAPSHDFLFCDAKAQPIFKVGKIFSKIMIKWLENNLQLVVFVK